MTSVEQPRQPAGSPEGGQFAGNIGHESGVTLTVLDSHDVAELADTLIADGEIAAADRLASRTSTDWGPVEVSAGSHTPWGECHGVNMIDDGIAFASTASHGGFKLSAKRNREVPAALREPGGWYEEDCGGYIVMRTFPDARGFTEGGMTSDQVFRAGEDGTRRWFGRQWADVTGNPVPQETLDQEAKEAERAAAAKAAHDALPDARRFYSDGVTHSDDVSTRTKAAIDKDLNQLWRNGDGEVRSLAEILRTEGVTGREVEYLGDGKYRYCLVQREKEGQSSFQFMQVSKATFEALAHDVPDTTKRSARVFGERHAAVDQLRKIERDMDRNSRARLTGNYSSALEREANRLSAAYKKATERRRAADSAIDAYEQETD